MENTWKFERVKTVKIEFLDVLFKFESELIWDTGTEIERFWDEHELTSAERHRAATADARVTRRAEMLLREKHEQQEAAKAEGRPEMVLFKDLKRKMMNIFIFKYLKLDSFWYSINFIMAYGNLQIRSLENFKIVSGEALR